MRFDMEVWFDTGVLAGDGTDTESLLLVARLLEAKAAGEDHQTVGLDGGRTKTTERDNTGTLVCLDCSTDALTATAQS